MASLPAVTGEEAIAAFGKIGFALDRIKGSHHILKKEGFPYALSVPVHGKQSVKNGTLRSLIRDAQLTVEEFVELLE